MCFKVDEVKTKKMRKGTRWIQCHRTFVSRQPPWRTTPIWGGPNFTGLNGWKPNRLHVDRHDQNLAVEDGGEMLNHHGLYCTKEKRKFPLKTLPIKNDLSPSIFSVINSVSVWIHPKDILAVQKLKGYSFFDIKARRMWVGMKPPTKAQLKRKPIDI